MSHTARPSARAPAPFRRRAAVASARLVLLAERLWPAILPALAPAALIAAASLFDLWAGMPGWAHASALAAAGAATVWLLGDGLARMRWPSRREALARVEADSQFKHAPLRALEDKPFSGASGEAGAAGAPPGGALWRAHIETAQRASVAARVSRPEGAGVAARDPFAVRYAAAMVLAAGVFLAGPQASQRLLAGLSPNFQPQAPVLVDVWIEPPAYTRLPPVYLARAGRAAKEFDHAVSVPEGSTLFAQVAGRAAPRLDYATRDGRTRIAFKKGEGGYRASQTITASGSAGLRAGSLRARWPIVATPDTAPDIAFLDDPTTDKDGALTLAYTVNDDYGVASAALKIRLVPDQTLPRDTPALSKQALEEEDSIPLDGAAGASGSRKTAVDLRVHPWAGLEVIAQIEASDGAGQTGVTQPRTIRLPARTFYNPLARAVIEQRRTLAVSPAAWPRVGRAFDALTFAPTEFYDSTTDYLLLRAAYHRVLRQDGQGFDDAVAQFWPLALQLEDEALELARRALEAAQKALQEALVNGASQDEIKSLLEDLRTAMNNYIQALAASGQAQADAGGQSSQTMSQADLDEMLDSIGDMSKAGANEAARQALSQLEEMLRNMRIANGAGSGSGRNGAPGEGQQGGDSALDKAGEMIGRQRTLSDETYERGRDLGATGDDLAKREGELADALREFSKSLRDNPSDSGAAKDGKSRAARRFGEALDAMEDAARTLNADDFAAANTAQERALQALREGAKALAEAGRDQQGSGKGKTAGGDDAANGRDPLGRPVADSGRGGPEIPETLTAEKARELVKELRRRLGERGRSKEEIEYLERLLKRF